MAAAPSSACSAMLAAARSLLGPGRLVDFGDDDVDVVDGDPLASVRVISGGDFGVAGSLAPAAVARKLGWRVARVAEGEGEGKAPKRKAGRKDAKADAGEEAGEARAKQKLVHAVLTGESTLKKNGGYRREKDAKADAGAQWFHMPAAQVTPEVKQDLRVLKLRGAYDPKRFYKGQDSTKLPKFFQMGTVVEGATDHGTPGARMTQKERKRSLAEEILHDQDIAKYRKRKFKQLQEATAPRSLKRGAIKAKTKKKHKKT